MIFECQYYFANISVTKARIFTKFKDLFDNTVDLFIAEEVIEVEQLEDTNNERLR